MRSVVISIVSAAILLLMAVPLLSTAQSVSDESMSKCAAMKSVVERIACFDDLTAKHDLAPAAIETTPLEAGKWNTSTKTDPMTDKPIHVALLIADSGRGRFDRPIGLAIRCHDNVTDMYVVWGSYLGRDGIRTTFRLDKEKAQTSSWQISTDSQATFFPRPVVPFLKKMTDSTSFVVSVTPYNENPITAVFDTTGAAEALADIRKGCSW